MNFRSSGYSPPSQMLPAGPGILQCHVKRSISPVVGQIRWSARLKVRSCLVQAENEAEMLSIPLGLFAGLATKPKGLSFLQLLLSEASLLFATPSTIGLTPLELLSAQDVKFACQINQAWSLWQKTAGCRPFAPPVSAAHRACRAESRLCPTGGRILVLALATLSVLQGEQGPRSRLRTLLQSNRRFKLLCRCCAGLMLRTS